MKNSRRYKTRIAVIVDNESNSGLLSDWGLSIYVESTSWRALFDAGSSPSILRHNAKKLGIDLHSIDFAVLSHYHYDHSNGFRLVGKLKHGLPIYVPPGPSYQLEEIGLKPIVVKKTTEVCEGVYVVGPLEAWENFYEIALAIKIKDRGLVLLVGCSHPGVDKIALKAREDLGINVYHVIGGFHGPSKEILDNLAKIATYISPSHCTGNTAKNYLNQKYPEKYREVRTGTVIEY